MEEKLNKWIWFYMEALQDRNCIIKYLFCLVFLKGKERKNKMSKYIKNETVKEVEPKITAKTTNENTKAKVKEVETKSVAKVFGQEDLISCRSQVSGPLYITGIRSGIPYTWADYNDVQDVEYRDLIYMVRSSGDKNIYNPRIIIEDDDFIEQNKQLKSLYESLYSTGDLRDIVKLPVKQMTDVINKLPNGAKESFKGIVSTMIDAHQLDSVSKIKAIDEIFGTRLLLTLAQE